MFQAGRMFACVNIVRMCGNSCGLQDCLSTPPNLRGRGRGEGAKEIEFFRFDIWYSQPEISIWSLDIFIAGKDFLGMEIDFNLKWVSHTRKGVISFFVGLNLKFCTFWEKEAEAVLSSNKFVWFISYWISRQTAPRWQNIHHITAHIFSSPCQIFKPTHTIPSFRKRKSPLSQITLSVFPRLFAVCLRATFKRVANLGWRYFVTVAGMFRHVESLDS